MAVSYAGLTIEFGGDTKGLSDALKTVQKDAKNTNSDLKAIDRSLKFNPGNTELLAQKVRNLNKAYGETKQKLDAYKQAQEQLEAKKKSSEGLTEQEQRQYEQLERSILQCKNQMERYEEQIKDTATELEASKTKLYKFGQTLEDNADKLAKHGENVEKVGKAMTGAATAVTAGSLAAFNEVDSGLDAVIKKTGATGDAADELGEHVKTAATTVAGASQDWETLGNAVGEISTRFGFTGDDLDRCSEKFLKFAEITDTDVTTAVALVSRAMGDAGIESSEYSDVLDSLAAASQASGIEVDKLAEMLTKYGAPMRALGFDTESAIAIFSQWEKCGVNTEIAFSGMKKAISNWSSEGKDAKEEFGKTLEEIAKCPDIASATTKSIEIFGAKAGPDLADAIQGGRFEYQAFMDSLKDSKGTVDETFDATVDGVDQVKVAEKELQTAGAELGGAFSDVLGPMMQDFASILHEVAEAFKNMSPEQREFIAKATLAAGALGVLTVGAGKLLQSAGAIGGALKGAAGLFSTFGGGATAAATAAEGAAGATTAAGGAMAGVAAGPVLAIVAAIAALVAIFKTLWDNNEQFRAKVTELWEGLKAKFAEAGEKISESFAIISEAAGPLLEKLGEVWNFVCNLLAPQMTAAIETITTTIGATVDIISGIFQTIAGIITGFETGDWTMFADGLKTIWDGVCSFLAAPFTAAWDAIQTYFGDKVEAIKNTLTEWGTNVKNAIGEKWEALKTATGETWEKIKSTVSEKANAIKDAAAEKWKAIKDGASSAFGSVANAAKDKFDAARNWASEKIDAIKDIFGNLELKLPEISLPEIKLPHFNVDWENLGPVSIPHVNVEWYAKGGMIEPNNPHLIGVGDSHEREWVEPESKLIRMMEDAVKRAGGAGGGVSVNVNVEATVSGNTSAYELGQNIGRGISSIMKQTGKAAAYA